MALLERLAILITADAAGALNEMKKVADSAEKDLGKAGAAGGALSAGMTKVGAAMMGVGAGMLMVGVNAAGTAVDLGKEVIKLQRYTGLTAEEASKLGYAAKMSGVDVDTLSTGLGKLAKTMDTSPEKFTKLGVEVKTSDGHLRGMTDVLGDVADKFKAMGPGTESTAAALELFGRNGASMLPFLLKGKEGIAELSKEAEKMGLVLSQDNVNSVKESIKAQREFGAAITGLKTQIGLEMLPILTDFTKLVTGLPGPVKDLAGPFIVIGGAVALAGGAFLLLVGQIQRAKIAFAEMSATARGMSTALGAIGIVLTGLAVVYGIYEGGVKRAQSAQEKFNADIVAGAESGGFDSMNTALDEQIKLMDTYAKKAGKKGWMDGDFFFWDRSEAEGKYNATKEMVDKLQNYKDMTEAITGATGANKEEVYKWVVAQSAAGNTFSDTSVAIGVYTGNIDRNKISAGEAAAANDSLALSIENANKALKVATDPYFAVIHAQETLTTSQTDYNEAVKQYGEASPQAQAAYVKQVEAALGLNGALATLGAEYFKGNTSQEKFQKSMEMLKQFGIDPSSAAGQLLIEKISGISWQAAVTAGYLNSNPLTVKTDTGQIDEAIQKIFALNKAAHTPTAYNFSSLPGYGGSSGNAMGGRIGPGMASGGRTSSPHLVGELGPEIFWPDSAGTIVTAEKTKQMLSSSGGGGTSITNVTINMPPGSNGADVVNAIKRYEKTNGTSWRN
ncbi:hypothetical protein UFOVP196_22 [uncultured Caudovirales phage]|uniref:Bacteriophage lambda, GpH, tail tape measure, C-terminal n=1 Tax=uncultured Caudovirales phage TaxID=2100421 RepID=A0A6J7WFP5_9CAUD|nr:hypothetical protein UFOVP196_22 [uncultured Caudovirales phage]